MLLFIVFIATFNLCAGYVLGVYIGVLPGFAPRDQDELGKGEPIELASAPVVERAPTSAPVPPASTTEPEVTEPVAETTAPSQAEEKTTPAAPPQAAEAATPVGSKSENIMAGLTSFREQLAKVGQDLRESEDDRGSVDQCAGKLKQANDSYLEKAHEVIDAFENDEKASNDKGLLLKESLVQQTDSVKKANAQIEEILAEEDTSKVKEGLLVSAEQLSNSAKEFQEQLPVTEPGEAADAPLVEEVPVEEVPLDATGLVDIDSFNDAIDQLLTVSDATGALQVASIAFDTESPDGSTIENAERLLEGLSQIVGLALDDRQMAAIDGQGHLLLLLVGDDEVAATGRCERARQQVAATTFRSEGKEIKATVSCAVADSDRAADRSALMQQLDDALEEAGRYGTNRTFHHDGNAPAPVVPSTVEVEPLEMEV